MNRALTYIIGEKRKLLGCACLFIILLIACPAKTVEPAHARNKVGTTTENELKAIYLYNFLKFIKWPENSCQLDDGRTHLISVLGDSPFEDVLMALQEKLKETDTKLKLIFYGPYRKDMVFNCCCLMFIADSERDNLPGILEHIDGRPILTVTDMPASIDQGVMITLVSQNNKIRWLINRQPVNDSGLKLSAKLLDIAVKVIDE